MSSFTEVAINPFSDIALEYVDASSLPNPFELPIAMTKEVVEWAEKINLFSGDVSSLTWDLKNKIAAAPNAESASYLADIAFEKVCRKLSKLDRLISMEASLTTGQVLKFSDVKYFSDRKDELLGIISEKNRNHPFVRKIFA